MELFISLFEMWFFHVKIVGIQAWLHATGKIKMNMGMFTYNREEAAIQTFKLKVCFNFFSF